MKLRLVCAPESQAIIARRMVRPSFLTRFRFGFHAAILFFSLSVLSGCAAGRPPIPPGEVPDAKPVTVTDEQFGHQVFQDLTNEYEQDYNHPRAIEVQNVVDRLTQAAAGGQFPWHVYIFKDASVKNAAATRGNHVFIWTGLLDATKNEAELATILAHEIAHVLAGHTEPDPNEEIKKLLINVGAMAAGIAVTYATRGAYAGDLGNLTSSLTEQMANTLLLYPYDRDKELEADQVGLFLMARAHYDPNAAIEFWSRAEADPELSGNLNFLSTHPPAHDRLERLKQLLPEAMAQYNGKVPPHPPNNAVGKGAAPPQPPFNTGEDSFAVYGTEKVPIVPNVAVPTPSAQPGSSSVVPAAGVSTETPTSWKVTAKKALVYARPSTSSKALGELRQGATIAAAETKGVWIRIVQPDTGYVRRSLATPIQ